MKNVDIESSRSPRGASGRRRPQPTISVIVPARNEARNLREILPLLPPVHEVILVDGHSVDGTIETAREVMPDIKVFQQTRRGKGNALAVGFENATGDIIVMFDADGSADPAEIPAFVAALVAGADFAKGSRYIEGGGSEDLTRVRDMGNAFLNGVTNVFFKSRYTDLCYGYNAFWRHILPVLDLPATQQEDVPSDAMIWGDGFEIETLLNCRVIAAGLKVEEVPSVEKSRIFGESNLNATKDGLRVLRTIFKERIGASRSRRRPSPEVVIDLTAAKAVV